MRQRLFAINTHDPIVLTRGRMLKGAALTIGSTTLAGLLLSLYNHLFNTLPSPRIFWIGSVLLLICLAVFLLADRGRISLGALALSLGFIGTLLILITPIALLTRPIGAGLLLPVLILGLSLGTRAIAWAGLGTFLIVLLLLTTIDRPLIFGDVMNLVFILGMSIGLYWLAIRTMERALEGVRRQSQLELQQGELQARLEQECQARAFIDFFTHELGGLAAGMQGLLPLLKSAGLPPADAELIATLISSSDQMAELVEDMRILIRQGNLSAFQERPVALLPLCQQAHSLALQGEPQLRVSYAIAADMVVQGDEKLLLRAVSTALRNAGQALAHAGSPAPAIAISAERQDGAVALTIGDNGPGFGQQILEHMVALASRPEDSLPIGWFSSRAGGTGRGVPLMEQVARLHRGKLSFGNNPGQGAWVRFSLPAG